MALRDGKQGVTPRHTMCLSQRSFEHIYAVFAAQFCYKLQNSFKLDHHRSMLPQAQLNICIDVGNIFLKRIIRSSPSYLHSSHTSWEVWSWNNSFEKQKQQLWGNSYLAPVRNKKHVTQTGMWSIAFQSTALYNTVLQLINSKAVEMKSTALIALWYKALNWRVLMTVNAVNFKACFIAKGTWRYCKSTLYTPLNKALSFIMNCRRKM